MTKKQCTALEKEQRVYVFVDLLANGAVTSDLIRFSADNWGIGRRMTEKYIAEARAIIVDDINQDRTQVIAEMLSVCRTLIKDSIKKNQLNVALGAVNTISRLGGLEAKP